MFEVNIPTFDLGNFVFEDYIIFSYPKKPKNKNIFGCIIRNMLKLEKITKLLLR